MLRIKGKPEVQQGLAKLLEDAAALGQLRLGDPVTVDHPSSATLHRCLTTIIDDPVRDSLVSLVESDKFDFGNFNEWQLLNAVNAIHINAGAPGMGVAIAIHEIWENYASRDESGKRGRYGPAHARALGVERDVASELTGRKGGRVAAITLGKDAVNGWVLDYEDYFLVLIRRPEIDWPTGHLAAAFHDRQFVEDYTIGSITAGQRVPEDRLGDVLQTLRDNPRASARVDGQRTGGESLEQAALRATAVRSAIVIGLDPDQEYADNGSVELERDANSPGTTLGALPAWVGPEQVTGADPGATVVIERPDEG
jgi:hypothetical protein